MELHVLEELDQCFDDFTKKITHPSELVSNNRCDVYKNTGLKKFYRYLTSGYDLDY